MPTSRARGQTDERRSSGNGDRDTGSEPERTVHVVRRARPSSLIVAAALAAIVAVIGAMLLVVAVADDGGDSGTVTPGEDVEPPLEGMIHWRAEYDSTAFPAALATDPEGDVEIVLLGQDTRVGSTLDEGNTDADLVALHRPTGRELWRTTLVEGFVTPDGAIGQVALARAFDGESQPHDVVAFDLSTGKELWRHTMAPEGPAPALLDDVVLIGGTELRALDPVTGREVWRVEVPAEQTPTVRDGIAYAVAPGQVAAVDVDDGEIQWVFETTAIASFATPAIATDDLVIAANRLGEVFGLDRGSGRSVYEVVVDPDEGAEGEAVLGLFGPENARVFAGTEDGRLAAFDVATGASPWARPTGLDMSEPVVVPHDDAVVLAGDESDELTVLEAATGSPRWEIDTGDAIGPLVIDEQVVAAELRVVDEAHDLVARDLESGREIWRVELEHPVFGAMIETDGLLFVPATEVGAGTDVIYAVR